MELTRSAEKKEFYKRLERVGEIEDSDDEAIVAAESFLRDARTRSPPRYRSRQQSQPSSSVPNEVLKQTTVPTVAASSSGTQSDTMSAKNTKRTKIGLQTQLKAVAVGDSASETQSDTGSNGPSKYCKQTNRTSGTRSKQGDIPASVVHSETDQPVSFRRVQTMPTKAPGQSVDSDFRPPTLKHSASDPVSLKKTNQAKRGPKRRKVDEVVARKQPQIFAGKRFFFVPNDDKNPARKIRITRVLEYGGILVTKWSLDVDFVSVEDYITYKDLILWLELKELPARIAVVNCNFVGDCLTRRCIMPAFELGYQIRGSPALQESLKPQPVDSSTTIFTFEVLKQSSTVVKKLMKDFTETSQTRKASPPPLLRQQSAPQSLIDEDPPVRAEVDELAQAIAEARDLEYLSFNDSQDGFGNDKYASLASLPYEDTKDWQKNFSCMHAGSKEWEKKNPNARTIDILDQMGRYYDNMGDQFRSISYRKAVTTLKKEYRLIVTEKDALMLPNVGQSIAEKIVEISLTNRLQKLDSLMNDPRGIILQLFTKVYGVGMSQASKWVGQGHKTLDDLKTKAKLTQVQKVGIEHYEDFLERIPRHVVKQHGDFVLEELRKFDAAYETTIGGSYRRGKPDSGDIDIIITKPGAGREEICELVMNQFIPHMQAIGFLTVKLSGIRNGEHGDKWHGCSCLPDTTIWRRIDLLLVPWDEIGAALIYFTGNDIFNRSIRLLASKKKMCLNQTGLYGDVIRKRNREKLNEGVLLESKSERRIFEILGVPWRPAEDRNL